MSFVAAFGRSTTRTSLLLALLVTAAGLLATTGVAQAATPYYWIIAEHSGKALMPENHRKDAGAPIVQTATPQNWGAQHWFIDRETDFSSGQTVREFRNRHSGYCIYVKYEDHVVGRVLHQDQCEKNYNAFARQWVVSSKSALWSGLPWTAYNRNSGQCMDVAGWSLNDYAPVTQYSCHGGANQRFRAVHAGYRP